MGVLNTAQIVALARKHEFTEAEVPDFAAVVMTESGGKTDAVQKGGLGRGLVQIDLGQHPKVTQAQAFDPDFSAAFARKLSRNKSGLGPTNWYGPRDWPVVATKARAAARAIQAKDSRTMKFVTRSEWGAIPANTSTSITPSGVLIHWVGPRMGTPAHADCAASVRGIQTYHISSNGWADIAYSLLVCNHGYVFEGRGKGRRTAANGSNDGNQNNYAICYLGGEGDPFTDAAKDGINDGIDYLGGGRIGGHRDATTTACPGSEIYAWVQAGHPRAGATAPVPCESLVIREGDEGACVKVIQKAVGVTDDGDFGPNTAAAVRAFQTRNGVPADGVVGPSTWARIVAPAAPPAAPPTRKENPAMFLVTNNTQTFIAGTGHSGNGLAWIDGPDVAAFIKRFGDPIPVTDLTFQSLLGPQS